MVRSVLKRKMLDTLRSWRAEKGAECLLIKGARQVGKSYIVAEFGRQDYESFISIDFIGSPDLKRVFDGPIDADSIYRQISLVVPGVRFVPGRTLLFLDEIQECPRARAALKYLALDGRCDVVASGSLLGIRFKEEAALASIPVGYEREVEMGPLDFEEYLWARGYGEDDIANLREYYESLMPVPVAVNQKMMQMLREYLAVGGMPAWWTPLRGRATSPLLSTSKAGCSPRISTTWLDTRKPPSACVRGRALNRCRASSQRRIRSSSIPWSRTGERRANLARPWIGSWEQVWCDGASR